MKDTYRTRLYVMIASTVPEKAAHALYNAVLELNDDTLELGRKRIYESGVTMTPTAALHKARKEMGPENE
jgi:hypothetical protein